MNSTTTPRIIDRLIDRAQRLYSLPAVAMKVVELTNQPEIDAASLKDCIEKDPALAAKVLRVVNSPLFGLSRQVSDLNQAVALLGTKPLKLLVLGFSLPDSMTDGLSPAALGQYWRHTLIKAVAAREISEQVYQDIGDDAFLAGLLQEIGVLVLIQQLGESYTQFLEGVTREGVQLAAIETKTLGFDHAVLSSRLLDHWGLPEPLVRAVGVPHDEQRILELDTHQRNLPQVLHLAELITRFLISERGELLEEILDVGGIYCDMRLAQMDSLIEAIQQKVPELANILSLELPGGTDYATVLMNAYQQISTVVDDPAILRSIDDRGLKEKRHELTRVVERFTTTADSRPQPDGPAVEESPLRISTTLEQDPAFESRVASVVAACRQARKAVSLLMVEIDHFSDQIMWRGFDGTERITLRLRRVIERVHGGEGIDVHLKDGGFGILLPYHERQPAVELAWQIVQRVRAWSLDETKRGRPAFSVSAGLATLAMPPLNFHVTALIEAAERCLSGVQLSGGDGVKSIDIY